MRRISRPKSSSGIKPLKSLLPYLLRHPYYLTGAILSLIFAAFTTLIIPLYTRRVIDYGFNTKSGKELYTDFLLLGVVGVLLGIFSAIRYFLVTWIGERTVSDIRISVFQHVISLPASFFEKTRIGEILSRLTTDTVLIRAILGSSASLGIRNIIIFIGALTMMFITSPILGSLIALCIPIIVISLLILGKGVRGLSKLAQDKVALSTAYATENLMSVQTIQSFTHEEIDKNNFKEYINDALLALRKKIWARAGITSLIISIVFISIVFVLWYGALLVLKGELSPGKLTQFILYSVFSASSLSFFSEVWNDIQQAAGATERLVELLNKKSDLYQPETYLNFKKKVKGEIEFKKVNFTYPLRQEVKALDNLSFKIEAGEKVALVGVSGAGKSTCFQLIQRFHDVSDGEISIDGINIKNLNLQNLRENIAIVPQEVVIFANTAFENIRFGRPNATSEEVINAAIAANADEFISKLPQKYETFFGERGVLLSGGQRQRIAIARAILRNAPILLLDEATNALDAQSENLVQNALSKLMQNKTVLIIAHQLYTVLHANRIIVLQNGKFITEGIHENLIKENFEYKQFAELQLNKFKMVN